ncbi:phospholipase D-like protein [Pacificibacter maritimus]|uniref:Phospholipase D-like protein n=1 Tax=Pacificibacter maritimus TaxID=762213 RepID=A0A3N4UUK2_9RHOB|nr:PLDc N-terminal domain-containing protein [Pacificibacter maritimus]RPE71261.1 phospholipase D-like protein [Pacificibacter maritimus]
MEYGIIGLLVLLADIYAIISIISSRASFGAKALWTLLVLALPVLGFIIWFFAGPRGSTKTV